MRVWLIAVVVMVLVALPFAARDAAAQRSGTPSGEDSACLSATAVADLATRWQRTDLSIVLEPVAAAPTAQQMPLNDQQEALLRQCRREISSTFMRGRPPRARSGSLTWSRTWLRGRDLDELGRLQRLADACIGLAADVEWICEGQAGVIINDNSCGTFRNESRCRLDWTCEF